MANSIREFKCLVVGNLCCKKAELVYGRPLTDGFSPSISNYSFVVDGNKLVMMDSSVIDERSGEAIRSYHYTQCSMIVLYYSVMHPDCAIAISTQWLPEVSKYRKDIPILLVGGQTELRPAYDINQPNEEFLTIEFGQHLASELGTDYHEFSAHDLSTLDEIYKKALDTILSKMSAKQLKRSNTFSWKKPKECYECNSKITSWTLFNDPGYTCSICDTWFCVNCNKGGNGSATSNYCARCLRPEQLLKWNDKSLKSLNGDVLFTYCSETRQYDKLFYGIKNHLYLDSLELTTELSPEIFRRLCQSLVENLSIKTFILRNTRLGEPESIRLSELMRRTNMIRSLTLSNNQISPASIQSLKLGFKENATLTELDIRDNFLNRESLLGILDMLHFNFTIITLRYDENKSRSDFLTLEKEIELRVTENRLFHETLNNSLSVYSHDSIKYKLKDYGTLTQTEILFIVLCALKNKDHAVLKTVSSRVDFSKMNVIRRTTLIEFLLKSKLIKELAMLKDLGCNLKFLEGITLVNLGNSNADFATLRKLIPHFKKATEIDLSNLYLDILPPELGHMLNFQIWRLKGNDLSQIPVEVKNSDLRTVQTYLKGLAKPGQWNEIKLMFLGKENAGKTSLVESLHSSKNIMSSTERKPTNGISITHWSSKQVKFSCFDMGGQVVFYPTHEFFLSSRSIYLVVFNLLRFDRGNLEYWLKKIKLLHSGQRQCPIFLVGTHSDELESLTTCLKIRQQVEQAKNQFSADGHNIIGLTFVSCKTGNGISNLKEMLSDQAIRSKFFNQVPTSYIDLATYIRKMKNDHKHGVHCVTWNEFSYWAKKKKVMEDGIEGAAQFLHDTGIIVHFNDPGLKDMVVYNPQMLADVMSAIVSFNTPLKFGVASKEELMTTLSKYKEHRESIMRLLQKFEIIFPLKDKKDHYLIPSILPEHVDSQSSFDRIWSRKKRFDEYQIGRVYRPKFLPLGFYPRLVVRLLHQFPNRANVHAHWRNGILFSLDFTHSIESYSEVVLISYDPVSYELSVGVRLSKKAKSTVLPKIISTIDTLFENYYDANQVQKFVPCSHCGGNVAPSNEFLFSYEECVNTILAGSLTVYCNNMQSRGIRLDTMAPDLALSSIPVIHPVDLKIKKIIGKGGFGQVFEAEFKGTQVAVKEMSFDGTTENDNPIFRFEQFVKEVSIMQYLKHENVIQVIGVTQMPRQIVMELAPLGDLHHNFHLTDEKMKHYQSQLIDFDTVRKNLMNHIDVIQTKEKKSQDDRELLDNLNQQIVQLEETRKQLEVRCQNYQLELDSGISMRLRYRVALDVAKGMKFLHSQQPPICHRDLRSPNIFLVSMNEDDKVVAKIGDFGMSRFAVPTLKEMLPTWRWLAPEVIHVDSSGYDERSDIYSYGILLWEIFSGLVQAPYEEFTMADQTLKRAILEHDLRPTIPNQCPSNIANLIKQCWQKDVATRPSFRDICTILCNYLGIEDDNESYEALLADIHDLSFAIPETKQIKVTHCVDLPNVPDTSISSMLSVHNFTWVGYSDSSIRVYENKSYRMVTCLQPPKSIGNVYCLIEVAEDFIWSSCDEGMVHVWDKHDRLLVTSFQLEQKKSIRSMITVKETVWILSIPGSVVEIWDAETCTKEGTFEVIDASSMVYIPIHHAVWFGCYKDIVVVDTVSKQVVKKWKAHHTKITSLLFNDIDNTIWSGFADGFIIVWDIKTSQKIKEWRAHDGARVYLSIIDNVIVSGSAKSMAFWDAQTYDGVCEEHKKHDDYIRSVVQIKRDDDCSQIWAGSLDGRISVWEISDDIIEVGNNGKTVITPRSPFS